MEGNSDDVEGSVPKFGLAAARWVLGRLGRQNSIQTERLPDRESLVRPSTTGNLPSTNCAIGTYDKRASTNANLTKIFTARSMLPTWPRLVLRPLGRLEEGGAPISQVVSDDPDSDGPAD